MRSWPQGEVMRGMVPMTPEWTAIFEALVERTFPARTKVEMDDYEEGELEVTLASGQVWRRSVADDSAGSVTFVLVGSDPAQLLEAKFTPDEMRRIEEMGEGWL